MAKNILLSISIIIGISAGMFLAVYPESESNSNLLIVEKLIQEGSLIMGNANAPITILEWGDYQCTFCYKFHQNTLDEINENYIQNRKSETCFQRFSIKWT